MNLIEIRELYKNQEAYLDKEITVGGMGKKYPRLQSIWLYCH